jgi:hypothetical protein
VRLLFFLLSLLLAYSGRAQTLVIEGTVVDAATQQPVPFASVGLLHTPLGTVSNSLGAFKLVIPASRPTDSLVVSCLGFTSSRTALAGLSPGKPYQLKLTPQAVSLQAASVVGYTPQTLLKRALRTTHARLLSPALFKSYYREFVRVNDTYTKFADGLVEYRVVTNPRKLYKPDIQVRVTQSRAKIVRIADNRMQDIPSVIDVEQAINGYERDSDIRSNFLDSTDFSFYHYELREPVGAVEEPFYVVSFTPTTHDVEHLYQGIIRIDKQTGCFQAIDVELAPALVPYARSANVLIVKIKESTIHKHLDYRQLNGRCYLGFVRVDYGADVTFRGDTFRYVFSTEMLVSDVGTDTAPISGKDQYHGRSLFKNGTHYTYPYWQQANTLAATPAEEAIIAGLNTSE